MRYSTRLKIAKKVEKFIEWLLTPVEKIYDKIEAIQVRKEREKRYHPKKIKKAFLKAMDMYLYHSSSEFDGDNEAILLIPNYNFLDEPDVFNYNSFYHKMWKDRKLRKILEHCRYYQTEEYINIFNDICDSIPKQTEEELKNMCKYYVKDKEFFSYDLYNVVEGQEVYLITRKIYEEKIVNG